MKPMVKMIKKTIIDQNAKKFPFANVTAHGKRKVTSKSKMMKRIATR